MFLQEEIAGRMQVSIMSKYSVLCVHLLACVSWCALVGLCVMVCTCWLVCHGVYLLACVSWCALNCWLVCHGVYLLACVRGGSRGGSTRLVRAPLFNLNLLIEALSHPPTTITSDSLHLWYNKLNNT